MTRKLRSPAVLLFLIPLCGCWPRAHAPEPRPVRIAYFLGGRTANMYRAAMAGDYEAEGVNVELLAKNLYDKKGSEHHEDYRKIDRSYSLGSAPLFGKATGDELIDYMLAGKADGATVGETAFIRAVRDGKPVIAVEELGFDSKTNPGHALVLKKGVLEKKIRSGQRLVLMSRRSSGGDSVFLREFFIKRGLDPDRVLDLRTNVPEDKFDRAMSDQVYDGAYIHLMTLLNSKQVQKNYDIYPLTWVDPQMSQAVLVFSKDYVLKHPTEIERLVRANMKRVAYDNAHQPAKTEENVPAHVPRDRLLAVDFHGMELPNFRNVPTVRPELLNGMQKLLLENGLLDKEVPLEPAIDNRFVLDAAKEGKSKNLVLITWGGAERSRVRRMMDQGQLPALRALEEKGSYASIDVVEGKPYSKAGLAQILTGYNSFQSRVLGRSRYAPIPAGWTLFERLKARFAGLRTVLLSGHPRDLGARGPHTICGNCVEWDPATGIETSWWDPSQHPTAPDGLRPEIDRMEGAPLFNARSKIDDYLAETKTTSELCAASLERLNLLQGSSFFAFLHFPGANVTGHRFGESSPEYARALREEDECLGKIRKRLDDLGEKDVPLMVTTENGMDPGTKSTLEAFRSFLVTDLPGLAKNGERRDLAPTVLDYFGIDPAKMEPPLPGRSLSRPRPDPAAAVAKSNDQPLRIGYFLGGRTAILYRALLADAYENDGLNVELMTKRLYDKKYVPMEKTFGRYNHYFGKASGTELVDGLVNGDFDFATIGETALILAAKEGKPIVAVAELGHDSKEHPGHGIILRHGIQIKSPEDLKHLRFVARRSSGGDLVMLREFLLSKGVDPDRDVTILSNLNEDKVLKRIGPGGDIDGGYYHLGTIRPLVNTGKAYLYQPLNWVDPHLSFAILVTSQKFAREHPERVEALIRSYMKYNRTELALPMKERRKIDLAGLAKEVDFEGLNFPQSEKDPVIRMDLLNQMQDLLVKHGLSEDKVNLTPWVDNHFVTKISAELDSKSASK